MWKIGEGSEDRLDSVCFDTSLGRGTNNLTWGRGAKDFREKYRLSLRKGHTSAQFDHPSLARRCKSGLDLIFLEINHVLNHKDRSTKIT